MIGRAARQRLGDTMRRAHPTESVESAGGPTEQLGSLLVVHLSDPLDAVMPECGGDPVPPEFGLRPRSA